jgi:hypothetical protein
MQVLEKIIKGVENFGFCSKGWIESPLKGAEGNVRNFREIKGEQKALRHDKSLSLKLDLPPLLRDC